MKQFFKLLFIVLWLIFSSAWASLAVNFGDSSNHSDQWVLAIVVSLIGFFSIVVVLLVSSWRRQVLIFHCVVFLVVLAWWLNISAVNDRDWQEDVRKLAYAKVEGDLVTVHNIRNFSYQSEFDYKPSYYDKSFDLNDLEGVDLFAVYWMGPAIAHVMISFDFGNDNHLAVSIEARKEEGEGYSTIKGFFRQYELIYVVADENDVIGLRTDYRNNPAEQVYRYRLKASKENAKRFFLEYVKNINLLVEQPTFYNTLISNCTSIIWMHSRVDPGYLPFSWKILLSGYLPEYLYESGRLDQTLSFDQLKKSVYINSVKK